VTHCSEIQAHNMGSFITSDPEIEISCLNISRGQFDLSHLLRNLHHKVTNHETMQHILCPTEINTMLISRSIDFYLILV
jgi:hypothetical protein